MYMHIGIHVFSNTYICVYTYICTYIYVCLHAGLHLNGHQRLCQHVELAVECLKLPHAPGRARVRHQVFGEGIEPVAHGHELHFHIIHHQHVPLDFADLLLEKQPEGLL